MARRGGGGGRLSRLGPIVEKASRGRVAGRMGVGIAVGTGLSPIYEMASMGGVGTSRAGGRRQTVVRLARRIGGSRWCVPRGGSAASGGASRAADRRQAVVRLARWIGGVGTINICIGFLPRNSLVGGGGGGWAWGGNPRPPGIRHGAVVAGACVGSWAACHHHAAGAVRNQDDGHDRAAQLEPVAPACAQLRAPSVTSAASLAPPGRRAADAGDAERDDKHPPVNAQITCAGAVSHRPAGTSCTRG